MRMRFQFMLASLFIFLTAVSGPASAQQQGSGLVLPISGFGDLGATFSGTLRIGSFTVQGNTLVATGVASGTLSDASGSARNLVTRLSVPVDLTASVARRNTDAMLATAACGEVLHLEFGAAAVQVLGSTLALNASALDVMASGTATTTAQTGRTTPFNAIVGSVVPGTVSSFDNPTGITTFQTGTTAQTLGGTSAFGSAVPGTVASFGSQTAGTVTTTVATQVAQPVDLSPLLCSGSRLRDSPSDRAQLVQILNRVIATIG